MNGSLVWNSSVGSHFFECGITIIIRYRWIGGESLYVCVRAVFPDIEERIPSTLESEFGTTAKLYVRLLFSHSTAKTSLDI